MGARRGGASGSVQPGVGRGALEGGFGELVLVDRGWGEEDQACVVVRDGGVGRDRVQVGGVGREGDMLGVAGKDGVVGSCRWWEGGVS